jgi:stress response protein SCP2
MKNKFRNFSLLMLPLAVIFGAGCPAAPTNSNTTIANTNVNVSTNGNTVSVGNISTTVETKSTVIESKEPDQYQATVMLKFETSGDQKVATKPIQAEVARNGADRRMEFAMPTNGEKLIYLERDGKQFVVMPQRKQYAELTKESLGFEVRSLMMPEQIVKQLNNLKGIERVEEGKVDGRDAIKYRFAATTDTKSQAGQVQTESFIIIDKETGLPLRSFTNTESQGNVQGIKGASLVTEINNIRTTTEPALFAEPTDFAKVPPEQIRQQVDLFFSAATAIVTQLLKSAQTQQNAPAASPMTTATVTPIQP